MGKVGGLDQGKMREVVWVWKDSDQSIKGKESWILGDNQGGMEGEVFQKNESSEFFLTFVKLLISFGERIFW